MIKGLERTEFAHPRGRRIFTLESGIHQKIDDILRRDRGGVFQCNPRDVDFFKLFFVGRKTVPFHDIITEKGAQIEQILAHGFFAVAANDRDVRCVFPQNRRKMSELFAFECQCRHLRVPFFLFSFPFYYTKFFTLLVDKV